MGGRIRDYHSLCLPQKYYDTCKKIRERERVDQSDFTQMYYLCSNIKNEKCTN